MKIVMLRDTVAGGKAVSAGDKVTIKDDEAIMLCTMGKARPSAEKAKAPKNRESDDAEKLATR